MENTTDHTSVELGAMAQGALSSHIIKYGGEVREQQEHMISSVSDAFTKPNCNAIIQAGTGTGKSLAYLFPALMSGQRTVIATATNLLSEQLYKLDLPVVAKSIKEFNKQDVSYALLKGRNNYACLAKVNDLKNLEDSAPLFSDSDYGGHSDDSLSSSKITQAREDSKQVGELISWADESDTGDRSDAIPVHERVWKQISVSSSECPGASNCPFGDVCFTEIARKKAKAVDVVITNHALLAQEVSSIVEDELSENKPSIFGEYQNLIIDEAHDLPDAITSALASELSPRDIGKFITKAAQYIHLSDDTDTKLVENARNAVEILEEELEEAPKGALHELPERLSDALRSLINFMLIIQSTLSKESAKAAKRDNATKSVGIEILSNNAIDIATLLTNAMLENPKRVRWVEKRGEVNPIYLLRVAPIEVSKEYNAIALNRKVLLTSATLTVGNSFEPIQRTLGIDVKDENNFSIDVGSPFDYPKQGMLYIPDANFPEPVGRDRVDHTKAVLTELYDLAHASGGRTLALFTTTKAAQLAAEYLRERISEVNIYAHGEAPADALVRMFREDETSILCATMGLWQGTNVPGPSCSLVVIDKVGFSPIDDVLTNARRELVSRSGRDGFKEIVVAQAATSLAQAAGRLIRSTEDKGVVAILDPRIRSKSYGKTLLASLPDFRIFSDKTIVTEALTRLTGGMSSVGKKPDIQLLQANPSGGLPNAKPKPSASSKLVRSSYKRNIGKNK